MKIGNGKEIFQICLRNLSMLSLGLSRIADWSLATLPLELFEHRAPCVNVTRDTINAGKLNHHFGPKSN